jgi:hypothetical protein
MSLAASSSSTTVRFGHKDLAIPGPELGLLSDSNALLSDAAGLRRRLREDGYLFIRGLHDPSLVREAQRQMLMQLAAQGVLDPKSPLMDGRTKPEFKGAFKGGHNEFTACPAYQELIRGKRCLDFFSYLRGGRAMTYDYQWLRIITPSKGTPAHFDVVYMGRGTHNLLTMWTPLGDIGYDMSPLAICAGSHDQPTFARLRDTYGTMDVDRDRVAVGGFANPLEFTAGRWLTSEFQAGDALIFGLFTLHASLAHTSERCRISSDTRYQLADEPVDERWIGETPKAHYGWHAGPQVSMDEKRKEWGV